MRQTYELQTPSHQVYGFASLLVPGLGHFLQGMLFRGLLWLTGASLLWSILLASVSEWVYGAPLVLLVPAVALYHWASMYAAMVRAYRPSREQLPLHTIQELMPLSLWKQVIGGTLIIMGVIAVVLLSGQFADHTFSFFSGRAHGGWWRPIAWGGFLSQSLILWAMVALGVWLFRSGYHERQSEQEMLREHAIITYALQHGGRITAAEASLVARLPLNEARILMERLVLERHATESEQDGIIYYYLTH